jgi:hypothetical protein
VLISFDWMYKTVDGVSGGRSRILQTDVFQDALVNNVFVPLFQRYANEDTVIAYEVANEPELAITEVGLPNPPTINGKVIDPVSPQEFKRFVKLVAAAAKEHALGQYVTLGSARAKWVGYWQDVGLDFYQFHYYPRTEDGRTLIEVLSDLPADLNRPVWLGEFPANLPEDAGFMAKVLEEAYAPRSAGGVGLAGAAPWSMLAIRDYGAPDQDALREFSRAHSADINS